MNNENIILKLIEYPNQNLRNIDSIIKYDIKKNFPILTGNYKYDFKLINKSKTGILVLLLIYYDNKKYKDIINKLLHIINTKKIDKNKQYLFCVNYDKKKLLIALHRNMKLLYFTFSNKNFLKKDTEDIIEYINKFISFNPEYLETGSINLKNIISDIFFKTININIYMYVNIFFIFLILFFLMLFFILKNQNKKLNTSLESKNKVLKLIKNNIVLKALNKQNFNFIKDTINQNQKISSVFNIIFKKLSDKLKINNIGFSKEKLNITITSLEKESVFKYIEYLKKSISNNKLKISSIYNNEKNEFEFKLEYEF